MQSGSHQAFMEAVNSALGAFRHTQPATVQGFGALAKAATTAGALSQKHKELIALAIGVSQHCSPCIAFHVKALIQLGCAREELEEMLAVTIYMGGGPSLMYAADTLIAWDTLSQSLALDD